MAAREDTLVLGNEHGAELAGVEMLDLSRDLVREFNEAVVLDLANSAELTFLSASTAEDSVLACFLVSTENQRVHRTEGHVKHGLTQEEVDLHEIGEEDELLTNLFTNAELTFIVHAVNQQLARFCQKSAVLTSGSETGDLVEDQV